MPNNSKLNYPKLTAAHKDENGFSLMELIIAMLIFLIVTGAIYGMLRVAQNSRSVVNEQVQLTKNVRLALNIIGRDTYNAGYGYPVDTVVLPDNRISTLLGIPNDIDTTRDTIPPIIAGNNITANNLNGVAGALMDQVTFLYKDSSFNLVGTTGKEVSKSIDVTLDPATATNGNNFDAVMPLSGSNSRIRVNDILMITGSITSTLGVVTELNGGTAVRFANNDVLGFNQTNGPLSTITPTVSIKRISMVTYFVTTDGILTRREYANVPPVTPAVAYVDEPLVYGVENFQIQYVMDNGTISNNPSAGPNGIAGDADDVQGNPEAIRQVRFTIDVRSTERNAAGQFYRASMTSTFSTRNLGYDAN